MEVQSVCPLEVASLPWMPRPGAHALTVVAKATFDLVAGQAQLADFQERPNRFDSYWNDDESCSVYAPSDLAPFKPRADVLLVGDAFAPGGTPTRSLVARLIVGTVEKAIEVSCDRFYDNKDELGEGEPFTHMDLSWERSAGGRHTTNPVGLDPEGERDRYGRLLLPNLVKPGTIPTAGTIAPIGFGPIAAKWSNRRVLLGRHASDWDHVSWSKAPMPTDIDGAFFQCAPIDQRLDQLHGNERITLENMHATEPMLVCHLPGITPVAFVDVNGAPRELPLRADTLWIDTTRQIVTVTWRGHVDLAHPDEKGCVYVSMAHPGETLTWADVQPSDTMNVRKPTGAKDPLPFGSSIDDEHTAIGVVEVPKDRVPAFIAEKQRDATRREARSVQRLLHKDDQSPRWLRDASAAEAPQSSPAPNAPAPNAPAPTQGLPVVDKLNSTVGYGVVSPWAGSGGAAVQAQAPAARKAPAPPPPPPPPGATGPPPPPTGSVAPPPMPAPRPPPQPTAPVTGLGSPAVNIRPPNPVEAMQARDRAEQSANDPPAAPVHDRLARHAAAEIVEVLWYDTESMDKVRAQRGWGEHFQESDAKEDEENEPFDFDEEPPPEEAPEVRDRRHIVAVMTRAHITTAASLPHAMGEAVDATGNFEPPMVVMSGRLHFPFDALKTLKATLAAVTPLIAGNKELGDTVTAVEELMATPWLEEGSGDVAIKLTDRIRDAFKRGDRLMDPSYLDDHTERILLEQRCYSIRPVFGDDYIRALLAPSSAKTRIPCYIPISLQKELPMFKSLPTRILAEAHVAQDQFESNEYALRVVAVGRVIQLHRQAY